MRTTSELKCLEIILLGLLSLTAFVTACGRCGVRPSTSRSKIIGGSAATPNSWPWMAYLELGAARDRCKPSCGGTIIARQWILTAAHCLYSPQQIGCGSSRQYKPNEIKVYLGVDKLSTLRRDPAVLKMTVTKVHIHPGYNRGTHDNDIALLKLSSKVNYNSKISPICPVGPSPSDVIPEETPCAVTGWGKTNTASRLPSDVLMQVTVKYITAKTCRKISQYPAGEITDNMVCAKDTGKDSCQGDSGGPLACPYTVNGKTIWKQLGIVSFGRGCALPQYPGVYTDVNKLSRWIARTILLGP
ncbi:transmembrane protease serine 5 [Lingula anatina]|uniref:Transmembrane protease serine 5 n=1 Tax=Lingula anatina TaxID=7574 RepID=A0A1S3HP88_LINAN|nr:transmembrane protease serine 5 [Lingula anatina]|eukprot:XP_013387356.1 transmembrane protease serine 5 [Lingula anatina]